jgi:hypothetical protein
MGGPLNDLNPENSKLQFAARALKRMGARKIFIRGVNFWKIEVEKMREELINSENTD